MWGFFGAEFVRLFDLMFCPPSLFLKWYMALLHGGKPDPDTFARNGDIASARESDEDCQILHLTLANVWTAGLCYCQEERGRSCRDDRATQPREPGGERWGALFLGWRSGCEPGRGQEVALGTCDGIVASMSCGLSCVWIEGAFNKSTVHLIDLKKSSDLVMTIRGICGR
jgi:hypothetical protein